MTDKRDRIITRVFFRSSLPSIIVVAVATHDSGNFLPTKTVRRDDPGNAITAPAVASIRRRTAHDDYYSTAYFCGGSTEIDFFLPPFEDCATLTCRK